MSRDRLAQMKAERDRARGYGQSAQGAPSSPPQQQYQQEQPQGYPPQQYGGAAQQQQQQQGAYDAPTQGGPMYPVQDSQPQSYGRSTGPAPIQQQQYSQQYPQQPSAGYGQQPQAGAYDGQPQQGGFVGGAANGGASAYGAGSSKEAFFAEVDTIGDSLQTLKRNITQINTLHNSVLNSTVDEQRQERDQRDLEGLTQETSRLTNSIKLRIKNLSELVDRMPLVPGQEGEKNARRMQVAALKQKFMTLIQEYREVERNSREKYRQRMERQYKIVKPDATQEEIKYAMDNDQGSQVFASALTQSTRYADARTAYREVQERHEDIKRIAATMQELQELFNDMAMLVERQDEQIQTIEATANNVETTMEAGHKEVDKAVVSAKKARRKRWICFWVLVILVIAIVLAVTLSILSNQGKI